MEDTYGTLVDKAQMRDIFGPEGTQNRRGIAHENGIVSWILVKVGASSRFPNILEKDVLYYCYSPDVKANEAMMKSMEDGLVVKVKVVPDGGTKTYYWGEGKVVSSTNSVYHEGRTFKRFVIHKLSHTEPCDEEKEEQPNKRQKIETYDSNLERRHAKLFECTGAVCEREPFTVHNVEIKGGKLVSYTPDFLLHTKRGKVVLEIKPKFPYNDEILKTVSVAEKVNLPVCILYESDFRTPFCDSAPTSRQGAYTHASGVKGIMIYPGCSRLFVAGYTYSEPDGLGVDELDVFNTDLFQHPKLIWAYEQANSI
jgi:hypothetical protein